LFCFVPLRPTKLGCFRLCSWSLWKARKERGAWAWFHGIWTCCVEVLHYWMISSLKTKLNCSWKFRRYWNVPLVLLERSWWAGFIGIYLVRFGFRMWEILIFKWFLLLKIQINSKRLGFERQNQLKTWAHLKAYHSMQTLFPFIFGCSKNWYIHCKTMFTCRVSLYCNGFTLGPTAQATLVYLWNKVVCLFFIVLYLWDPPNQDASDHILGLFGKLSRRRGASIGFMVVGLVVQKFLNIEWFLHCKLH